MEKYTRLSDVIKALQFEIKSREMARVDPNIDEQK